MNKDSMFKISMRIDSFEGKYGLTFEEDISAERLAKICRKDMKLGGGCPLGNVLSCPFLYEPYRKRHIGERPISCDVVTANDWIELYKIINEDQEKKN